MSPSYSSPQAKRKDFWLAFAMWFVVNISVVVVLQLMESAFRSDLDAVTVLQIGLNLLLVIVLAIFRRFAALGMLAAFATTAGVVFLQGIFIIVSFFFGGYTWFFLGYPPHGTLTVTYLFQITALVVGAIAAFPVLRAISRGIR